MKRSAYLTTAGYIILFGLICTLSIWVSYHGIADWTIREQRGFWNQIGFLSIFFSIVSISLWLFKKKIISSKQNDHNSFSWVNRTTVIMLRELHVVLGWFAFALGFGHSAFFLLNVQPRANHIVSGVIVLVAMLALIFSGLMYKHKVISIKTIKKCHYFVTYIFAVLLVLHI